MLKSDIVDFVKVVIHFESLDAWDFGLGKSKMYFVLELKKKNHYNLLLMKLDFFFFFRTHNL